MDGRKTMEEWMALISAHKRGERIKDTAVLEIKSPSGTQIISLANGSEVNIYPQNSDNCFTVHITAGCLIMGNEIIAF